MKKLKKAGVNASKTMALTGHKNQQSLTDYDEIDNDDHIHLGRVLSYDKNEVNTQIQYTVPHNPLLRYSTCGPAPVFNMQNCNITIEAPSYHPREQASKKRRCHIIDSDSE